MVREGMDVIYTYENAPGARVYDMDAGLAWIASYRWIWKRAS